MLVPTYTTPVAVGSYIAFGIPSLNDDNMRSVRSSICNNITSSLHHSYLSSQYLPLENLLEFLYLMQINTINNATIIVAMTTMIATSGPAITPIFFPARISVEENFNKANN